MATLTEAKHPGEFLVSESDDGLISRDSITVLAGQKLEVGTVLGRIETAAATAVAAVGNTGDGTMGAITESAGVREGVYVLKIIKAAANAGDFQVANPQGNLIGFGTVGAPFSGGGLAFTLSDGANDFVVGDTLNITVAAGSKKYVAHDPAATDGSQKAVAILFDAVDATAADQPGVAIARLAEVNGDEIIWKTGISGPDQAAGIESLKAQSVIIR